MAKALVRSGLFAAAIVAAFGAAQAQEVFAEIVKAATGDFGGRITVPETGCVLANNVWDGQAVPKGFSQGVFVEKHGGKFAPGWRWNAPGTRATVLGMPEIICGDKPWDAPQKLRSDFPFRAGEKRLQASFDIELKAEGRYNMAFSLWAVSKLPAVKENISLEIMVWNVNSGEVPGGEKVGTLAAGGTAFDIYLKGDQGMITGPDPFTWKLVSFVARKPLLKGSLDFGTFIDELLARNILARDDYLTSFELGNEVSNGTGRVAVRTLDLDIR